jgi:HAD superfamily hydrolase (TIGR01458 family)
MPKLKHIKGFLIDLDGTLYVQGKAIPGAVETVNVLQQKYPVFFLSNTTSKTKAMVIERMKSLGFNIREDQIFTALEAIKQFLKKEKKGAYCLLSDTAREELNFAPRSPVEYVVVGHARANFVYENINTAFRHLLNGAQLIAAARTRYFKDKDGEMSLDGGAFTVALEFAAGQEAQILGKPSKSFFLTAVENLGLKPSEVAMIGDDIENDILGAQNAGLAGVQVKTGKFREEDLGRGFNPDALIPSIAHLPELLG